MKRLAATLDVDAIAQAVVSAEAESYLEGKLILDAVTKQVHP